MDWTGIILRLLAWLRPLLWYRHAFCRLITVALRMWQDEPSRQWFAENPRGRADFEQKIADAEQCLDIIVGLRARELLGLPIEPEDRPGLKGRCARLRAANLRRERDSAPIELTASHRPAHAAPAVPAVAALLFRTPTRIFTPAPRIRAPP